MIFAADRCRERAPNIYIADSLSEVSGILNPRLGDVVMIIAPGVFESWRLQESSTATDGFDIISSNSCEYLWIRAGSIYNVLAFGADPSGESDSTDAIQQAADQASISGGTVYFPPGRYLVTDQINISSTYPVNLLGDMFAYNRNGLSPNAVSIILGATIAGSIFRYFSPVASRGMAGGGCISGLSFRDETAALGQPGTYTIDAALDLYDFNYSVVEKCYFWNLNGSCIKTNFCVQSNFLDNQMHYSGATSKPAFWLSSTDASHPTQNCFISGGKIEACYSAPYLQHDAFNSENKITGYGFEAETAQAASNQFFIRDIGGRLTISSTTFNRNTATQVQIEASATLTTILACSFRGTINATPAVVIAGSNSTISTCEFNSAKTGDEILITGTGNSVINCKLLNSGAITCSGTSAQIIGNFIQQGFDYSNTSAYWVTLASEGVAVGNTLISLNGNLPGGILATGATPRVEANALSHFTVGAAIVSNSNNAVIIGNTCHENTVDFQDNATTVQVDLNWFNTTPYLQKAVPLTPGIIAGGASFQTQVAGVTRAVRGDFAFAGFTEILQGITLSAMVYGNGLIEVTFTNVTGAPINLPLGTLKVWVRKAMP